MGMSADPTSDLPHEPAPDLQSDPQVKNRPAAVPHKRTRLSIAHLLLWTLGTAIVLAFSRAQLSAFEMPQFGQQFAGSLGTYFRVVVMVAAPFTGIAVALLFMVLWRLYRRQSLPLTEPGHWILLIFGVLFFVNAAGQLASAFVRTEAVESLDLALLLVLTVVAQGTVMVVAATLCWTAWGRTPGPPRWRFVFGSSFVVCIYWLAAVVLGAGSMIFGEFAMLVVLPLAIVAIPVFVAWLVSFPSAVIQDLWLRERYDALHWAGVALVLVNILTGIAGAVVPLFIIRQ